MFRMGAEVFKQSYSLNVVELSITCRVAGRVNRFFEPTHQSFSPPTRRANPLTQRAQRPRDYPSSTRRQFVPSDPATIRRPLGANSCRETVGVPTNR